MHCVWMLMQVIALGVLLGESCFQATNFRHVRLQCVSHSIQTLAQQTCGALLLCALTVARAGG